MIGIITYDAPHRKTQDLVTNLILNGFTELHLIAIPWIQRKSFEPIFKHRPSKSVNISIAELCDRLKITFSKVELNDLNKYFTENSFNHIMIGGAGLLHEELAKNHKIINSHPGYLPNVKGLDAFKWAIYQGHPIGVTTHYISDKADEGELIERRVIPVYFEDTFHNIAYRIYETEIEMLVNAIKLIDSNLVEHETLSDDRYVANKRMPHNYELIMMNRFEELRKKSNSHRAE
jgi:phosphoribosylglycinamide formyltransferase-1